MSDTPDFKNPEYTAHEKQLTIVDDVYKGVDTSTKYIRAFQREDSEAYKDRQSDAALDNYVFNSIQTIKNIIFRKPISTTEITNTELLGYLETIDLKNDINSFGKEVLTNRVKDGMTYILVDATRMPEDVTNKAEQEQAGVRPYLVNVLRKNLINWGYNNDGSYSWVSIQETYTEKVGKFGSEQKQQIRVLYDNGTVEIWRDNEVYDTFQRGILGITLIEVGNDLIPPFYDMTKLNLIQFNRNSERQNYTRVGSAPFPIIKGNLQGGDNSPKTMAVNQGLHFSDTDGGFEWGELSGNNDKMIKENIEDINVQMLNIAVSFTTKTNSNIKTAEQVSAEKTDGESKLTDYATELEEALNQAIQMMALFKDNTSYEGQEIQVNMDYDSNILDAQQVQSYLNLFVQGVISWERFLNILEKGEVLESLDEKDRVEEKAMLNDENLGGGE